MPDEDEQPAVYAQAGAATGSAGNPPPPDDAAVPAPDDLEED